MRSFSLVALLAVASAACTNAEVPAPEQWRTPSPSSVSKAETPTPTPDDAVDATDAPPQLSAAELQQIRDDAQADVDVPADEAPAGGFAPTATAYARVVVFTNGCVTPHVVTVDQFGTGYSNEHLAAEYANYAAQRHLARVRGYFGANCFNDFAQGVGSTSGLQHGAVVATNLYNQRIADYGF